MRTLLLLLGLLSGCTGPSFTHIRPSHFEFVPVVQKKGAGAGGWWAACIRALVVNAATGEPNVCQFGVEMPVENHNGPLSRPLAQRIAADCAEVAAKRVLDSTTPDSMPGLVCIAFRKSYDEVLRAAVAGSRVRQECHEKTRPVEIKP